MATCSLASTSGVVHTQTVPDAGTQTLSLSYKNSRQKLGFRLIISGDKMYRMNNTDRMPEQLTERTLVMLTPGTKKRLRVYAAELNLPLKRVAEALLAKALAD